MFDFYERRKIKQWLYSWPFLIILIFISVLLIRGVSEVYQQERITRVNKNQRIEYLEELENREDALQKEIDRLNTGRGVEEEIRQKFEVAKEGEEVIVIVEPPLNGSGVEIGTEESVFKRFFEVIMFWK